MAFSPTLFRRPKYEGDYKITDDEDEVESVLVKGEQYTLKGKKLEANLEIEDSKNTDNRLEFNLETGILGLPPVKEPWWKSTWEKISKITSASLKVVSGYAIIDTLDKLINGFYKEYKNAAVFKVGYKTGFKFNSNVANDKVNIKSDGSYGHSKQYELASEVAIQTAKKDNSKRFAPAELKMVYGSLSYGALDQVEKKLNLELSGDITGLIKDNMRQKPKKKKAEIDKRSHDIGNPSYKSGGEPLYLGSIIFKIKPGQKFDIKGSKNGEPIKLDLKDFICLRASLYVAADGKIEIRYNETSTEEYKFNMAALIAENNFENEAKQYQEISVYQNIYKNKSGLRKKRLAGSYYLFINQTESHKKTTTTEINAKLNLGLDVGMQIDFVVIGFTPLVVDIGVNNSMLLDGKYKKDKSSYLSNGKVTENQNTVKEGYMNYKATLYGDLYYELLDFSNKPGKEGNMKLLAEELQKQTNEIKGYVSEVREESVNIIKQTGELAIESVEDLIEIDPVIASVNETKNKLESINKIVKMNTLNSSIRELDNLVNQLQKIRDMQDASISEINSAVKQLEGIAQNIEKAINNSLTKVDRYIDKIYSPINIFKPKTIAEIEFRTKKEKFEEFEFLDEQNIILRYDGSSKKIIIPAKIRNKEVLEIFENVFKSKGIESLAFEKNSNLVKIGDSAFEDNNLKNFKLSSLPKTVKSIGSYAFKNAGLSGELRIPHGMAEVGWEAFANNRIKKVYLTEVKNGYEGKIFTGNPIEEVTFDKDFRNISDVMFEDSKFGNKIKIEDSNIEKIGEFAFRSANISKQLQLPNTLKVIGGDAFANNKISGELILPDSIERVEDRAFAYNNIRKVYLPKAKYGYGKEIFIGNNSYEGLEEVVLSEDFEKVDDELFSLPNTRVSNGIDLYNTKIKEIGNYALSGVAYKGELKLPETIERIGVGAFGSGITKVVLPKSLKKMSKDSFDYTDKNLEILFAPDFKVVGRGLFNDCGIISAVNLMDSNIEVIENGAFRNSRFVHVKMKNYPNSVLTMPESLKKIGSLAFKGSGITRVYLPQKCEYYSDSFDEDTKVIGGINLSEKSENANRTLEINSNDQDVSDTEDAEKEVLDLNNNKKVDAIIKDEELNDELDLAS